MGKQEIEALTLTAITVTYVNLGKSVHFAVSQFIAWCLTSRMISRFSSNFNIL